MIRTESFYAELSGRTGLITDRHVQGEFKYFELILDPKRILSDDMVLYITTAELFPKVAAKLSTVDSDIYSFIVCGNDVFPEIRARRDIVFDVIEAPIELITTIAAFVSLNSTNEPPANENRYVSAFLTDIVDGHISGNDEIIATLKNTPIKLLPHIAIIVVEAMDPKDDMPVSCTGQFAACFPGGIATYHHGDILILTQKATYPEPMVYNQQGFENLLRYYDAIAVRGEFTKWLTTIRTSYTTAKHILPFARAYGEAEKRFYTNTDFAYLEKVSMCADHARSYLHGDVHHFCCPSALYLKEYYLKHDTDYCSIMAIYLDCERNLSLTAETLSYNRNTLKAKLDKVQDIMETENVDFDLDDPLRRWDFRFSLYLIDYISKFLNRSAIYSIKERIPPTAELVKE